MNECDEYRVSDRLFMSYSRTVIGYPIITISTTVIISLLLTSYSLIFNHDVIDFDPTKGFETRGTELASARLTLDAMTSKQAPNEKILRWYYQQGKNRKKRETQNTTTTSTMSTISSTTTIEPITVDYDEYGVNPEPNKEDLNDPCEMYAAIGSSISYNIIELLSKIMIKISSYDKLFTVPVMKSLCQIDEIIEKLTIETNFTNLADEYMKHSLNLPLYTSCPNMTTANTCEDINQHDISTLRSFMKKCRKNPKLAECDAFSINQINNWLVPMDWKSMSDTVITVVLRVPMWDPNKGQRAFYDRLIQKLKYHLEENSNISLVGVSMNMKEKLFSEQIYKDMVIASSSAILVFICFLTYSRSLVFTIIIITIVMLSAGVAFFIYTKMSNLEYKVGSIYVPIYREYDLLSRSLRSSLHHSLTSMFVTSLTTATTFLTNLSSHVIVLRCFGIYACLTVIVNYILVVLILPGAIILTKPIQRKLSVCQITEIGDVISKSNISNTITQYTKLLRFPIMFITGILTGLSFFIVFKTPGLTVPQTNPTKLFVDSNIHEYYDNNVHHFNFPWKRSARIIKNFVFGIPPLTEHSLLSPKHKPSLNFTDMKFEFDMQKLEYYRWIVENESSKYKIMNYTHTPWSDKILRMNETCLSDKSISGDCIMRTSVKHHNLIHDFPDDYSVVPGDGTFITEDMKVVGYFISIPTNEKLRIDAKMTEKVFIEIFESCENIKRAVSGPVFCLSSAEMTRFYDTISQLKSSTFTSVLISIIICLFVIIICTRVIKLSIFSSFVILSIILWTVAALIFLGWKLSVVESTIIIITIGLSFDYTLHYVVAIRETKFVSTDVKIQTAHSTAGIACLFGSITLILSGIPLLFTQTASFYQIGTMLVVLGFTSIFGAAIVLPAFVFSFSCSSRVSTKL